MAMTPEQLIDFQSDLAISDDQSVFTDDELQRLYSRAEDDYNRAVYYAWRQVLAGSAKWVDYQVAQTKVSKSQAFQQIKDMVAFWSNESRDPNNQVKLMGVRGVPTQHKPKPIDEYHYHRRNAYRYPY